LVQLLSDAGCHLFELAPADLNGARRRACDRLRRLRGDTDELFRRSCDLAYGRGQLSRQRDGLPGERM
jgi:hypothetical protein